ncbi:MAG: hypothetical protein K9N49_00505 [Candidatus Marinimicrobia bacterium]|nr:hypothetical protein [Candidatus Neomarinimicrobiota bacterium]
MKERYNLRVLLKEIERDTNLSPEDPVLLDQAEIADFFPPEPAAPPVPPTPPTPPPADHG